MKVAGAYELVHPDSPSNGRPCWIQRVAGVPRTFVFAQSLKPDEPGFPYVETLLLEVSDAGIVTRVPAGTVLGEVTLDGDGRRVVRWTDGTNVTWVQRDRPRVRRRSTR